MNEDNFKITFAAIISIISFLSVFLLSSFSYAINYSRFGENQERVTVLFEDFGRLNLKVPPPPSNLPTGIAWLTKDEDDQSGFDMWKPIDSPSYGVGEGAAHSPYSIAGHANDGLKAYLSARRMNFSGLADSRLTFQLYADTEAGSDPLDNDDYLLVRIKYWDKSYNDFNTVDLFDSRQAQAENLLPDMVWTEINIQLPEAVNGSDDVDLEFIYITGPGGILDTNGAGVAIDNVWLSAVDGFTSSSPPQDSVVTYIDQLDNEREIEAKIWFQLQDPTTQSTPPFLEYDLSRIDSLKLINTGTETLDKNNIASDLFEILGRGRPFDLWKPVDWFDSEKIITVDVAPNIYIDVPHDQLQFSGFPLSSYELIKNSTVYITLANESKRQDHYTELLTGMLLQSDMYDDPYIKTYLNAGKYGAPNLTGLLIKYRKALDTLGIVRTLPEEDQFEALLLQLQAVDPLVVDSLGDLGSAISVFAQTPNLDEFIGEGASQIPGGAWIKTLADTADIASSLYASYLNAYSHARQEDGEAKQLALKLIQEIFYDNVELNNKIDAFQAIIDNSSNLDPALVSAWQSAKVQALASRLEVAKNTFDDILTSGFSAAGHIENMASILSTLQSAGWSSHLVSHIGLTHGGKVATIIGKIGSAQSAAVILAAAVTYKFFMHAAAEADILADSALSYHIRKLLLNHHQSIVTDLLPITSTSKTLQNYRTVRNLYGMHSYLCWRDIAALQDDEYDQFLLDLVSGWTTSGSFEGMLAAYRERFSSNLLKSLPLPSVVDSLAARLTILQDQDDDGIMDGDDNCPTIYNPEQDDVCPQIVTDLAQVGVAAPGGHALLYGRIAHPDTGLIVESGELIVTGTNGSYRAAISDGRARLVVNAPASTESWTVELQIGADIFPLDNVTINVATGGTVTNLRTTVGAGTAGITYSRSDGYSYTRVEVGLSGGNLTEVQSGIETSFITSQFDPGDLVQFRLTPYNQEGIQPRIYGSSVTIRQRVGWGGTLTVDTNIQWPVNGNADPTNAEKYPHIVCTKVVVPVSYNLSVEAGSWLLFKNKMSLLVEGGLNIEGTQPEGQILLGSYSTFWQGIVFEEGSTGVLRNAVIEHAGYMNDNTGAAILANGGDISMDYVTMRDIENPDTSVNSPWEFDAHGIFLKGSAKLSMSNSTLTNIEKCALYDVSSGSSSVIDSYFTKSSTGIITTNPNISIVGNIFAENAGYGLKIGDNGYPAIPYNANNNLINNGGNDSIFLRGKIVRDTTFENDIIVDSLLVNPGITLTIKPGIRLQANRNFSNLEINGTLKAEGTVLQPIIFTSKSAGTWRGIVFEEGSSGVLRNAVIEHAGYMNDNTGAAILANGGDISMDYVTMENIENPDTSVNSPWEFDAYGIFLKGSAKLSMSNSTLTNIEKWAVYDESNGSSNLLNSKFSKNGSGIFTRNTNIIIRDNIVSDSTGYGLKIEDYYYTAIPSNSNNTLVNNGGNNSIFLKGKFSQDTTIENDIIFHALKIAPGVTLTISAGKKIQADRNFSNLEINGTLKAEGTVLQPIIFTSKSAGTWRGIVFEEGSSGVLRNAVIEHAGYMNDNTGAAILANGGDISMDYVTMRNIENPDTSVNSPWEFDAHGIFLKGSAKLSMSNSTLTNIEKWAVYNDSNDTVGIVNSSIYGNGSGVYSSGLVIDARYVEWGDPSGPYHPTLNPSGLANRVSDNVLFVPWGVDSDSDFLTDYIENQVSCLDSNDSDSDNDGLLDGIEDKNFNGTVDTGETDPCNLDSDNDGLSDGDELNQLNTDPLNSDSDEDGMPDGWEVQYDFDPLSQSDRDLDSDNDGLSNYDEFLNSTDPIDPDSDNDGMNDGWELQNGLNPNSQSDRNLDSDNDGLSNHQEYIHSTDPSNPDSDGDNLLDGDEVIQHGTDPSRADTDNDNLPDGWEVQYNLNPLSSSDRNLDPDDDELSNYGEFSNSTDPNNPDTENDGMPDGWEVGYGLNPLEGNDRDQDLDSDTIINIDEYLHNTNPTNPDTDSDHLTDDEEINVHHTDPCKKDTDGDDMPDGWEVRYSLAPLNASDRDLDPDNDTFTNYQEYINGTDPMVPDNINDENPWILFMPVILTATQLQQ